MTKNAKLHFSNSQRQRFLDDVDAAHIENLQQTMHQPDKKGAVIRPDPITRRAADKSNAAITVLKINLVA